VLTEEAIVAGRTAFADGNKGEVSEDRFCTPNMYIPEADRFAQRVSGVMVMNKLR
jgi:hypothetical protein